MENGDDNRARLLKTLLAKTAPKSNVGHPRIVEGNLSALQKRMLFFHQLSPSRGFYNVWFIRRYLGTLRLDALQQAIDWMVQRHEILRTTYQERGDEVFQRVLSSLQLPLEVVDLRQFSGDRQNRAAQESIDAAVNTGFDLERGPVLRALVIRLDEDDQIFLFVVHHIAFDLWSAGIFLRELENKYNAIVTGVAYAPAPLPIRFLDHVAAEAKRTAGGLLSEQKDYWTTHLRGVSERLDLPTDYSRPAVQSHRGAVYYHDMTGEAVERVPTVARESGCTPYMVLLAGFFALLWRYSGQDDICVGSVLANRNRPELEGVIGFFANTIALRAKPGKKLTFRQFLGHVRKITLDAFAHPDLPLDALINALAIPRDPAYSPLFQVTFALQTIDLSHCEFAGLREASAYIGSTVAKHDFSLFLFPAGGRLIGLWEYCTDLYCEDSIRLMALDYEQLVAHLCAHPDDELGESLNAAAPSLSKFAHPERLERTIRLKNGETFDGERVERILLEFEEISECAVLRHTDPHGCEKLVAYLAGEPIREEILISSLTEAQIPEEARPVAYVRLKALPRKTNGNIDAQRLRTVPAIDKRHLRQFETKFRQFDGVTEVHATLQPEFGLPPPPLHLSDIDPRWQPNAYADVVSELPQRQNLPAGLPPALVDGGPPRSSPDAPETLQTALLAAAANHPDHGLVCIDHLGRERFTSYPKLEKRARRVAAGFADLGLSPGSKVILQLPDLEAFFTVFWGCLLSGVIPTNVAVPPVYEFQHPLVQKLFHAWQLYEQPTVIVSAGRLDELAALAGEFGAALRLVPAEALLAYEPIAKLPALSPKTHAFYQLTSGSTGVSKAVIETHGRALAQIRGADQANGYSSSDVSLNWLSMDHVVPLLTTHLKSVYLGCMDIHVTPQYVLEAPLRWLDLMERHRVVYTWAPNFAYRLISEAVSEHPKRRWDLSCVRFMMNAGEQITGAVVQQFIESTAPFGLSASAHLPAYGMAETGTAITYHRGFSIESGVRYFSRSSLAGVMEAADAGPGQFCTVDNGNPIPGIKLRVVDERQQILPERVIGRLQVSGASVTPGYYRNEEANNATFTADGWLDTGDLACLVEGRLFLTGRAKEIIIVNGANFQCYDIEECVSRIQGVKPTYVSSCAVGDADSGTDRLVIFFVADENSPPLGNLLGQIRQRLTAELGVAPGLIIPLPLDQFPKTTAGKIQRTQLKRRLAEGYFDALIKELDIVLENENTLPDWFFEVVWERKNIPHRMPGRRFRSGIIFGDQHGLADEFCRRFPFIDWTRVEFGNGYNASASLVRLDPRCPEHYRRLFSEVDADVVIDLRQMEETLNDETACPPVELQHYFWQAQGFLSRADGRRPYFWLIGARHSQSIEPDDPTRGLPAAISALARTLQQEQEHVRCRLVDLPAQEPASALAAYIGQEIGSWRDRETDVAYRHAERLVSRLARRQIELPKKPISAFKERGCYALSGGLGGLGQITAHYLLENYGADVLLLGRRPLQEHAPEVLANFARLQNAGGRLRYAAVDITNRSAVSALLSRETRIDGVLHLAGAYGEMSIGQITPGHLAAICSAKIAGTENLLEAISAFHPESRFVLFSSVHAHLGAASLAAYATANRYAQEIANRHPNACTLAWSVFDNVGMSAGYPYLSLLNERGLKTIPARHLGPSLEIALKTRSHVIIGLDDSKPAAPWLPESKAIAIPSRVWACFRGKPSALPAQAVMDAFDRPVDMHPIHLQQFPRLENGEIDELNLSRQFSGKKAQTGRCVAPRTLTEEALAAIWRELLGIVEFGVDDNFFELGGHSLLAARLFAKIRERLQVDLPLISIFQEPTIERLAQAIQQRSIIRSRYAVFPDSGKRQLPPLFLFHPAGGDLGGYRHFLEDLNGARTVICIPSRLYTGQKTEHSSLAAMVEEYADIVISAHPDGPYHLFGWSMGGMLAHQIGALLERRGIPVGFVGLCDTWIDPAASPIHICAALILGEHVKAIGRASYRELRAILGGVPSENMVESALGWALQHGVPCEQTASEILRYTHAAHHHLTLMAKHRIVPFSGQVSVWWADESRAIADKLSLQAYPVESQATQVILAGGHFSVLTRPYHQRLVKFFAEFNPRKAI